MTQKGQTRSLITITPILLKFPLLYYCKQYTYVSLPLPPSLLPFLLNMLQICFYFGSSFTFAFVSILHFHIWWDCFFLYKIFFIDLYWASMYSDSSFVSRYDTFLCSSIMIFIYPAFGWFKSWFKEIDLKYDACFSTLGFEFAIISLFLMFSAKYPSFCVSWSRGGPNPGLTRPGLDDV